MEIFRNYIKGLKEFNLTEITEHSHRKTLQELLLSIASEKNNKIKILHEPKRKKGLSPDFKISINESIVGYVENKGITEDLIKILKSEQIQKYKELSENILLTNYIDWVWVKDKKQKIISLCSSDDLEKRNFKLDETKVQEVYNLILNFFSEPPLGISKPKELARALAIRGKWLNEFLRIELHRQEKENPTGKLFGLYDIFKNNIHTELTLDSFADAFSQTLIYGLFLAKLNSASTNGSELITLYNAKKYIPVSFELIKELLDFIDELEKEEYLEVKWIVEEVLSIMNNLNLEELQLSLSYKKRKKQNSDETDLKDPYVYFYEDFLSAYDKKLRKAKGVYYTPPPVVNFIVRAIDDLLIEKFNIKDGLADREKVTVLDFATGTGTFLLEIFKSIFDKLPSHSGKQSLIVKNHILKNLYGFEYLIAPYTIAHLKLSQFLIDNGYKFEKNERIQVYLTNTLEPVSPSYNAFIPALSEESRLAKDVKDKPILVITGNPPYSGHSQNPSWKYISRTVKNKLVSKKVPTWIGSQIENYKLVDGKPLGEKNPKWLQDDYVKFIRFAQHKMEQVDEGIVGIITNHSFLDNPTFRGMRQSLMNTFDEMYFLDLHGNAKKKEKTPDGGKDENVFDIEPGVCISLMIKSLKGILTSTRSDSVEKSDNQRKCKIYYSEFWGLREEKYSKCLISSLNNINWKSVYPSTPEYIFKAQDKKTKNKYNNFYYIKDIFDLHGNGIVTKRDNLVVDVFTDKLKDKLMRFIDINISDSEICNKFNIPLKDKDKWDLIKARDYLSKKGISEEQFKKILYRVFDIRYVFFDPILVARLVKDISNNFDSSIAKSNYGLLLGRAGHNVDQSCLWNLVFVTNIMTDINLFYRGGATNFLLYRVNVSKNGLFNNNIEQNEFIENFNSDFRKYLNNKYKNNFESEEIFGYIYAALHSPTYRAKYSEYLKTDFPRIPFTDDINIFKKLSSLGWELIQIHLMNKEYLNKLPEQNLGNYTGNGNNEVIKVEYIYDAKTKKNRLKINPTQYFDNVPEDVYNFYIGGYQVLDKYLKDRKNRTLTLDEIENVENIVKIISFTISQMNKLNTLTKEWI